MRYAIKHEPSGKFYYEDEGGAYLVDEKDGFFTFGEKGEAEEILECMVDQCYNDCVVTEDGDFLYTNFKVVEL